ncbi:MAG: flagellar export chaperone FliS [bacterium]
MAAPLLHPQQHYLKTQIETASQPQLLVMIFDAAVKKLHIARQAVENREIEKAHVELTKVQKMFVELMVALDFDKGGDLAHQLWRIYDFVYHHLVMANIKQNAQMIEEVLPIVENLREGWTQAVAKFLSEEENRKNVPRVGAPPRSCALPLRSPSGTKPVSSPAASSASPVDTPPRPRLNIRG